MTSRNFAQTAGIVYLAVGVLGFIPGLLGMPRATAPSLALDAGYGLLFGLFPVNLLHNLVHLGVGAWGLTAARNVLSARSFARGLAYFYGALAIMGLIPGLNTLFGLVPLFGHDIWLHALTAAAAAYFGFGAAAADTAETQRFRRAA